MGHGDRRGLFAKAIAKAALLSVSYLAIDAASDGLSHAQTAQQGPATQSAPSQLPPVQIDEPTRKPRRQRSQPNNRAGAATARRRETPRTTPPAQSSVWASTYDARTGTVGVYANSTSVATKINTPLVNIPQSLTVVTKDFITDQRLPEPDRRHALRSGRRHPPGRRQSRRTRHSRRRFQRQLLRQRLSRRRAVFPRPLQRAEHRDPEGTERADLRPRRRRRPAQPHAQGSRRHQRSTRRRRRPDPTATGASRSMPARPSTRTSRRA